MMDNFQGTGRPLTATFIDEVCSALDVTAAELWAVVTVETRGFGYLDDRKPVILFERHKFHEATAGKFSAANPEISNPVRGGYLGGKAEYGRLAKAISLNREAALRSTSWGIGQIMGFNYSTCGCETVSEFVSQMVKDENSQLNALLKFVAANGLDSALRERRWAAFALGYNGPRFRDNDYEQKLAAAHAKNQVLMPDMTYRTAQAALLFLGINPGPVDGIRGRLTHAALSEFQDTRGLPVTAEPDDKTLELLMSEAFPT